MSDPAYCQGTTRRGAPCGVPVPPGAALCHVHDPDALYARQHPTYRAALIARGYSNLPGWRDALPSRG